MKRILSILMAALLLVSAIPAAYAAEGEHDYSNGTQITLVGTQENQGAQWTVTVPAKMQPGQTGTVKAEGTWAADQFINVHAPQTVTLTYGAQSMDVAVTFGADCGFAKIGSNTDEVTYSTEIKVAEANRLFGTWEGIIEYEVKLIENGDINRDGVINADDADALSRHTANSSHELYQELTVEQQVYADLDGDGDIDTRDQIVLDRLLTCNCCYIAVNAVQPVEVLKGDANNDGVLTMHDKDYVLTLVASNFNGLSDEEMAGLIARADMDGDGSVGANDAAAIDTLVTNSGWVAPYVNPHTYNGVELPGLPEWDKATYPYAVITEGDEYAPYYLNLYTHAVKHDDNKLSSNESGAKVLYGDIDDYGEWNLQPKAVAVTEQSTIDYPIVWSNFDILNADGSVYMAASDPVPVS